MKALVCEMCQSNDLVKQDGYYVCQHCGTKYSVEEAKKLMVEGTVKIDDSDELRNLYEIARRARSTNNSEDAAKYYDMILVKDPSSWEATFYSVYYKAASCKIIQIASAANSVANVFPTVVGMVNFSDKTDEDKEKAICELIDSATDICWMLFLGANEHFEKFFSAEGSSQEGFNRVNACITSLTKCCTSTTVCSVNATNSEKIKRALLRAYETEQKIFAEYYNVFYRQNPAISSGKLYQSIQENIDNVEKDFIAPLGLAHTKPTIKKVETTQTASKSGGGCYVATAVYGSYDCPQVWTLRRFRDNTLAETWYGRAFIHTYYAISPTLVKWFGKTEWFKNLWKPTLDRMVERLNNEGVENTPYSDRNW